jgi:hypothetical protein
LAVGYLFFVATYFSVFQIPVPGVQDFEAVMLGTVLLAAFLLQYPLAAVGSALAGTWDSLDRAYGIAPAAFEAGAFAGPVIGLITGGFIVSLHASHS